MELVIKSACSVICWNFCCRCCAGADRGIPRSPAGLTPAYLTGVLRAAGALEGGVAVTAAQAQKVRPARQPRTRPEPALAGTYPDLTLSPGQVSDEETGLTSSVYFLKLAFDGATQCPTDVVVKMLNDVRIASATPAVTLSRCRPLAAP